MTGRTCNNCGHRYSSDEEEYICGSRPGVVMRGFDTCEDWIPRIDPSAKAKRVEEETFSRRQLGQSRLDELFGLEFDGAASAHRDSRQCLLDRFAIAALPAAMHRPNLIENCQGVASVVWKMAEAVLAERDKRYAKDGEPK